MEGIFQVGSIRYHKQGIKLKIFLSQFGQFLKILF